MMSTENRTSPNKGILLTSQCSGSEWLASSLSMIPGFTWNGEKLIKYSLDAKLWETVSWDVYQRDLESALSADNGEMMVGCKLMYDQIPQHLYAEFSNYLGENQVHVIHLRRRCVALQVASQIQKALRIQTGKTSSSHFTSKENVDMLPSVPKIQFKHWHMFRRIKNLEENQATFAQYLRATRAPVFEVAYEDLDGLYTARWFNALSSFLGHTEEVSQESDIIKVGSRRCEDRIDGLGNDFEALAGLESRVECYRLRTEGINKASASEGNTASASALFLPPQKGHCLLAPQHGLCPPYRRRNNSLRVAMKKKTGTQ